MSQLISFVLADSSFEPREESEYYKMKKSLSTAGLEPTISRLLEWHSNRLCYQVVLTLEILGK